MPVTNRTTACTALCRAAFLTCLSVAIAHAEPRARYSVEYDAGAAPPRLAITIHATGLAPADADWSVVLDGWGGWPDLEYDYLVVDRADPPLGPRDVTRFPLAPPQDWDGSLSISCSIPLLAIGTPEQQARSILPASGDSCMLAAVANTIPRIYLGGEPLPIDASIRIVAPEGWTVFTGWAGASVGAQESRLPAPGANAIYAVGRPFDSRVSRDGLVEVIQFSDVPGAAPQVLDIADAFVRHVASALDQAPPAPVRICISPATGGGYLTDHGLVVGLPQGSPDWFLDSPYFRHLVCHELFHIWLGHMLTEAESERTVWFKEGFTDYLSLWHGAACGVLPPDWFATRMIEIESDARNSALGSIPFADQSINWRDGDGPNETMAYKGGALLALALDAELRRSGPGLSSLLRDMLREGDRSYSAQSIRRRLEARGLGEFDRLHVSGTQVPSARGALISMGYGERHTPTDLAYVGLRTEPGDGFGRIVAIDPDGPAAGARFLVGDIIGGLAPGRDDGVRLDDTVTTPYDFGLTLIAPTDEPVSVWVHRPDPVEIKVRPRLIPGGLRAELVLPPDATLFTNP